MGFIHRGFSPAARNPLLFNTSCFIRMISIKVLKEFYRLMVLSFVTLAQHPRRPHDSSFGLIPILCLPPVLSVADRRSLSGRDRCFSPFRKGSPKLADHHYPCGGCTPSYC